jgi:Ca2+-binding RTX toxin-like protein
MGFSSFNTAAPADANVTLDNIVVRLTGQADIDKPVTPVFIPGIADGGGSAFLDSTNNNGNMVIRESWFDEAGFRDTFVFVGWKGFVHTGSVTLTNNTFTRTAYQDVVRIKGNRLENVKALLQGNTFENGTYLDLYGNISDITLAHGNTFKTVAGGYGIRINAYNLFGGTFEKTLNGVPDLSGVNVFTGPGLPLKYIDSDPNNAVSLEGSVTINDVPFTKVTAGGQSNDTISLAGGFADWANGDDGNDSVAGADGNDWLIGGSGSDTLVGGDGADTFFFQKGDSGNSTSVDEIGDFAAADTLVFSGAKGAPVITNDPSGMNQYQFLVTWADDATETFTIVFSNGFNPLSPTPPPVNPNVSSDVSYTLKAGELNLTLTGSENINGTGNERNNRIEGNSGINRLEGLAGNDTLVGGAGNDSLLGGDGDDTLVGAQGDALLNGGDQASKDILQLDASFNDASDAQIVGIEEVILTATGLSLVLDNQSESYTLRGFASGGNSITGGLGNDTIFGGIGIDSLRGGSGNDSLSGGDGNDTLNGGAGADTLIGEAGADSLVGGGGDDILVGAQDDTLLSGNNQTSKDILQIGADFNDTGNTQIVGIEEVVLTAAGLTAVLDQQSEAFTITGFASGGNTITGGSGNNTIVCGTGTDSLSGLNGADSLSGGDGNDTLIGGAGADTLVGGAGADQFIYAATGERQDTITDFSGIGGKGDGDNGDTLRFKSSSFGSIALGSLTNANFSNAANGTSAQFIYNAGVLTYDSNGINSGGSFNMLTLTGAPELTAADIVMF